MVKNLPAMLKTQVQSLSQEDYLERKWHPTSFPWTEEPRGYSRLGCKELDMTEWLTDWFLNSTFSGLKFHIFWIENIKSNIVSINISKILRMTFFFLHGKLLVNAYHIPKNDKWLDFFSGVQYFVWNGSQLLYKIWETIDMTMSSRKFYTVSLLKKQLNLYLSNLCISSFCFFALAPM